MSDYLTPGGSPVPGMEGRRAIYISSERDRIAKLMAQDALDAAAGLAERDAASPGRPTRPSAVAAAKVATARKHAKTRREVIIFAAGFAVGAALVALGALALRFV